MDIFKHLKSIRKNLDHQEVKLTLDNKAQGKKRTRNNQETGAQELSHFRN